MVWLWLIIGMRIGRNTAVLPNPMSSYATIAVRLTLFPRIKVGECMCQKVKFWCTLLSFWIVLISISDKRISGHPESLFFKIFRGFGTSRKLIFRDFEASGLPESLFFKISRLRDSPKACFSDFSSFGTPRKLIFRDFEASGHPESLFFKILRLRGIPTAHFSRKQLPNFSLSDLSTYRQRTFPNVSSDNNKPNRCFHRYLGEPRDAH